jgi:hypothetical protein
MKPLRHEICAGTRGVAPALRAPGRPALTQILRNGRYRRKILRHQAAAAAMQIPTA